MLKPLALSLVLALALPTPSHAHYRCERALSTLFDQSAIVPKPALASEIITSLRRARFEVHDDAKIVGYKHAERPKIVSMLRDIDRRATRGAAVRAGLVGLAVASALFGLRYPSIKWDEPQMILHAASLFLLPGFAAAFGNIRDFARGVGFSVAIRYLEVGSFRLGRLVESNGKVIYYWDDKHNETLYFILSKKPAQETDPSDPQ